MTLGLKTIIFPADDLGRAKGLFTALLGAEPYVDSPYYVGWRVDGVEVGLNPHGHGEGMDGPIGYFNVDDMDSTLKLLGESGAEVKQAPTDVGGGMLIATVKDAEGNVLGLRQEP